MASHSGPPAHLPDTSCTGVDPSAALEAVRALARAARILERTTGDLGMPQYRVLAAIAAGDERASRVAERLELGRPAVSAAVDALCRGGLVRRTDAAGDQRAFDLTVTPAGRSRLAHVEGEMAGVLSDLCARAASGVVATARDGSSPDTHAGRAAARAKRRVLTLDDLATLGPAIDTLLDERSARRRGTTT